MQIPYDMNTGIVANSRTNPKEIEFVDSEFYGKLKIMNDVCIGRSSVNFHLIDDKGRIFDMMARDMAHMASSATINKGVVEGDWSIRNASGYYKISFKG